MTPSLMLSLLLSAVVPSADDATPSFDWPQWRGPQRTGSSKETGLLKVWPEGGPTVVWKADKLGGGYSTPSVSGGRIFGMGYQGADEVVWALSEKDGSKLWEVKIAKSAKVGYGEGSRSTPTVDGDLLYCVGAGGDLVCLKTADGAQVWSKNFGTDFKGKMMSGWGFSESPLIDGKLVLATPGSDDATIVAFDKKTGDTVWKAAVPKAGGAGYSSIVTATVGGKKLYLTIVGKSAGVIAVDDKGAFQFRYERIANGTANIPTIVVRGNTIFASTGYGDGGSAVLKLAAKNGKIGFEEIAYYPAKELQNHHGGMVLVGNYVYMGHGHNNGTPLCAEFATGKVVWKADRGVPKASGSAGVAYADGHIYMHYDNGIMALIEASPKAFKLISSFALPDQSNKKGWAHPVIANGKLIIRDQDKMVVFDLKAK